MPDEPEVDGAARADAARSSRAGRPAPPPDGDLVLLADQDRSRWDRGLIAEGQALVRQLPAAQPARPVPDPGGDQRRPQRRADRGRHRLAADPAALRPAPGDRAEPGRGAQPRGRGGRGRGTGRGARPRRRPRPRSATTCSTPSAPTCCDAWAATPRRRRRTRRRSPAPRTRPSAPSCSAGFGSSIQGTVNAKAQDAKKYENVLCVFGVLIRSSLRYMVYFPRRDAHIEAAEPGRHEVKGQRGDCPPRRSRARWQAEQGQSRARKTAPRAARTSC